MKTIVGIFENYRDADQAITNLQSLGIDREKISVVAQESAIDSFRDDEDTTSGVQTGLASGAAIGGIAGLVAGISAIVIPGVGPIITAGTLGTALGSTLAGAGLGAAAGGLVGALTDLGVSEDEAQWYAEGVNQGNILVSAQVPDEHISEANRILDNAHAIDRDTRPEWTPLTT